MKYTRQQQPCSFVGIYNKKLGLVLCLVLKARRTQLPYYRILTEANGLFKINLNPWSASFHPGLELFFHLSELNTKTRLWIQCHSWMSSILALSGCGFILHTFETLLLSPVGPIGLQEILDAMDSLALMAGGRKETQVCQASQVRQVKHCCW